MEKYAHCKRTCLFLSVLLGNRDGRYHRIMMQEEIKRVNRNDQQFFRNTNLKKFQSDNKF